MEINQSYLQKFKVQKRKLSRNQFLANEIYEWLGKEVSYPFIMKLIKERGWQFVYEVYHSCKKIGMCNKRYFLGAILKQKINYKCIK